MGQRSVIVIGGGVAGLSCAIDLLDKGHTVTLVDRRPLLGGRAYTFKQPQSPSLDNGLHVTLGCYDAFLTFLDRIGAESPIRFQERLTIPYCSTGTVRHDRLASSALPAPAHLLSGLRKMDALDLPSKLQALRIGPAIWRRKRLHHHDMTVQQWLAQLHQSQEICDWLWDPITLAALNRNPQYASAKLFTEVLYRAFFTKNRCSTIGIFQRHLGAIIDQPARTALLNRGGSILFNTRVDHIETRGNRIEAVRTHHDERLCADDYVLAIPHFHIDRLLTPEIQTVWPASQYFRRFASSPIVNVYLQYDSMPLADPFICMVGTTMQWAFDVSDIFEVDNLVSLTVSDARHLVDQSQESIAQQAHNDLRTLLGQRCPADFRRSWVTKEKRSTVDHTPQSEQWRPGTQTPFTNLFMAGDWTNTGLPCTLEGAAWSGQQAATAIAQ